MANPNSDEIRLQMVMAFGQGAGCMLATPEALAFAMSSEAQLINRAVNDWDASQYAFTELTRLLGQLAATRAAASGRPRISKEDVQQALPLVLPICPCFGRAKV